MSSEVLLSHMVNKLRNERDRLTDEVLENKELNAKAKHDLLCGIKDDYTRRLDVVIDKFLLHG